MQAIFTSNVQIVHARLVQGVRPDSPSVTGGRGGGLPPPFSFTSPGGLAALNGEISRQAAMVAYVDVFHLMCVATVVMMPLVLLLKPAGQPPAPGTTSVDH